VEASEEAWGAGSVAGEEEHLWTGRTAMLQTIRAKETLAKTKITSEQVIALASRSEPPTNHH